MATDWERVREIYWLSLKLHQYVLDKGIAKEALLREPPLQWLVTTPLINIGEQAGKLTKEYREAHAEVQWSEIAGMRHRLVHNYEGTNWNIIAVIVFDELPILLKQLEVILEEGRDTI